MITDKTDIVAPSSQFYYATCNAASGDMLKGDVASRHRRLLRPAFMRPQIITWKGAMMLGGGFELGSVFARATGLSLGMFATEAELAKRAAEFRGVTFHLHVFPMEITGDGVAPEVWARIDQVQGALVVALQEAGVALHAPALPKEDEWVLDVIVGAEGEKLFLGAHKHTPGRHPQPGALPRLTLPEDAPSRAWLKLEQAFAFAGFDREGMLKGKVALELGCAPGGASYAMLNRGMRVIGVDPAEMDSRVANFRGVPGASFKHLPVSVNAITRKDVPSWIDLLVSDMNLAPPIALRHLERLQSYVHAATMIITLKLNDRAIEQRIEGFIDHLRHFAPEPLRVTQLPANRAEICVVAGEF